MIKMSVDKYEIFNHKDYEFNLPISIDKLISNHMIRDLTRGLLDIKKKFYICFIIGVLVGLSSRFFW